MMEGLTLETPERLSNLLEGITSVEHMNFVTSQTFGLIQYLLAYETLAKKFYHDVVLIGFLPENDFTDSNWEIGQKAFYNRYRPYFVGTDGNYKLVYFNEAYFDVQQNDGWQGYLWNKTMTSRTIRRAYAVHHYQTVVDDQIVPVAELLTVVIVTIPFKRDLLNLRDRGTPPLTAWFRQMSKDLGFTYVDLLPILGASPSDWESYYHEYDRHWTAKANALVAKALAPVMEQVLATANARHNNH